MEDFPADLHTLCFESETPMLALEQPLKAARLLMYRLHQSRSIKKLSLCLNVSEDQRKMKTFAPCL